MVSQRVACNIKECNQFRRAIEIVENGEKVFSLFYFNFFSFCRYKKSVGVCMGIALAAASELGEIKSVIHLYWIRFGHE